MAADARGAPDEVDASKPQPPTGATMQDSDDDEDLGEAELRARLRSIEDEHTALLSTTIGAVSLGNAELAERANELRDA
nr:hypothetical protein [Microbacterium barkeri]